MRAQDTQSVAGDHQFLVGGDDVAGDPRSLSRDAPGALGIRLRVKLKAEPGEALRHGIANGWRVLADAGGEHEAVDAAHGGRQHPGEESDAVDEIVERELGARVRTREQVSHVVADAGQPLETAVVIEQMLDLVGAHALLGQEIEHDAGVELPWTRSHGQAVKCREAHGALDALAGMDRAHRGAATEMGDDHAALRNVRRQLRQLARDVFVRQPVEAVAADAFLVEALRQRVAVGDLRDGRGERPCRNRRLEEAAAVFAASVRMGPRLFGWWRGASGAKA